MDKKPLKTGQLASPPMPRRGRRRFLQGSLGAAPVVMTLVSRPVLGADQCFTTSASLSMPSSHQHTPVQCSGGSPTFWSQPQNFDQWPAPYSATNRGGPNGQGGSNGPINTAGAGSTHGHGLTTEATLFAAAFQPSPYPPGITFLTVLQSTGTDGVAAHLAAAKLNVAKGWTPVLDDARIQMIWLEYTTQGYYAPTAGVKWFAPEIVAYLESLENK